MMVLGLIPGEPNRSLSGSGGTIYQSWQEKHPTTSWPPEVPTEQDLAPNLNYWPVHTGWLQTRAHGGIIRPTTNPWASRGAIPPVLPPPSQTTRKFAHLGQDGDGTIPVEPALTYTYTTPKEKMSTFQKWTLAFSAVSTVAIVAIAVSKVGKRRR